MNKKILTEFLRYCRSSHSILCLSVK